MNTKAQFTPEQNPGETFVQVPHNVDVPPTPAMELPVLPSREQSQLLKDAGKTITEMMLFDERLFKRVSQMGQVMAGSKTMVPRHLQGNASDCTAVIMQAMRWGLDCFAVAQKTHVINGVLGYEAQLINSVILANAPIEGRPQYQWYGDWDKILGKFVSKTSGKGNEYQTPGWKPEDEEGLGVKLTMKIKGEEKTTTLDLKLRQAMVRNSTLWAGDPRQQLAYLAIKRFARLYFPDVIMGVYSDDELEDAENFRGPDNAKNITPEVEAATSKTQAFASSAAAATEEVAAENKKAATGTMPANDEPKPEVVYVKTPGANERGEMPYNSLLDASRALLKACEGRKKFGKTAEIKELVRLNEQLMVRMRKEIPATAKLIDDMAGVSPAGA